MSGQWMAGASRAFEERERHLRSRLSMEKSLRRVVLRRLVELTPRKRPFGALPRNDAMGQKRHFALRKTASRFSFEQP